MDEGLARAFGKVLRAHRRSAGLSQEQLAFAAELSRNYVSLLETGSSMPTLEVVFALARVVGREPGALVHEVDAESGA